MSEIWKSVVSPDRMTQFIKAPGVEKILSVGETPAGLCIWYVVNPKQQIRSSEYAVIGTGWLVASNGIYRNTCVDRNGLVWHLFQMP